ncbi:UbiA family prenyltransferase [Nevskia ramosa]|uniref:UbiA family prenyltransferase n=1 Tax=Nevskia ramosa TaxID=64002 RepID=UPI003D12BEED
MIAATRPARLRRPLLIAIAGLGVAAYLAAALIADTQTLASALRGLGFSGLGLVLGASLLNYALRFQRWSRYLATLGHRVPPGPHRLIYIAGFAFTVSPGKAGEAVRSLYLHDRYQVPYADSMATLFVERLLDVLAIAVLASLIVLQDLRWWPLPVVALLVVAAVVVTLGRPALADGLDRLASRRHGRLAAGLAGLAKLLRASKTLLLPGRLAGGLLLGLVAWGVEGLALYWICQSLALSIALPAAVGVYGMAVLAGGLAFFMPGGLGGMEVAMPALLVAEGAPLATAVIAMLLCRLATLWFAVLLGLIAAAWLETRHRRNLEPLPTMSLAGSDPLAETMPEAPLERLPQALPLCVDLDGTLTPVDTLHEALLDLAKRSPGALLQLPGWMNLGKAAFKREVAARSELDVATLPWRQDLLDWLREQRDGGCRLVLATAAHHSIADAVAAHLGIFDEVIATGDGDNLHGDGKRRALVARFGERGYDYVGNEAADLAVWGSARNAIVVGNARLAARAFAIAEAGPVFAPEVSSPKTWIKAMRLYQWVKNLLVFVPAVLAHRIGEPAVLFDSLLAFLAFGLAASSVYLVNDLLDLAADRQHRRKCLRPFASGRLSAKRGVIAASLLLLFAVAIALWTGPVFAGVLALYFGFTLAYSLWLKRATTIDVMTLAGLYTLRIIAGGAATEVSVTFWLLAFSMFLFLSLAMAKRYTELFEVAKAGAASAAGRGYQASDLPALLSLGISAGYAAVVIMALYVNSVESLARYGDSHALWLTCPLMLYWISRVWMLSARGRMTDDPIVFALTDRISLGLFTVMGFCVLLALWPT